MVEAARSECTELLLAPVSPFATGPAGTCRSADWRRTVRSAMGGCATAMAGRRNDRAQHTRSKILRPGRCAVARTERAARLADGAARRDPRRRSERAHLAHRSRAVRNAHRGSSLLDRSSLAGTGSGRRPGAAVHLQRVSVPLPVRGQAILSGYLLGTAAARTCCLGRRSRSGGSPIGSRRRMVGGRGRGALVCKRRVARHARVRVGAAGSDLASRRHGRGEEVCAPRTDLAGFVRHQLSALYSLHTPERFPA